VPQNVEELAVWQKAIDLTVCIYQLTRGFPKDELYGLVSQLRRAAVSVASNIAEGRGRLNQREFRQFLGIALGSIFEIKTQLVVAGKLEMGSKAEIDKAAVLSEEVSKMLTSLINKLGLEPKAES
jgi:four helix bundle protein